jgi:hypothetical protein
MTSTDIISRGVSLADLVNSKSIDFSYKSNSLNEAFKDIHNELTNSDENYFLVETMLTITSAMAGTSPYEFYVPLPANCYKIRSLDWKGPQGWTPMKMFNYELRDDFLTEPMYRLRDNKNLWVVTGGDNISAPFPLRLAYFTPPPTITLPSDEYHFATTYNLSDLQKITTPFYFEVEVSTNNVIQVVPYMLYIFNSLVAAQTSVTTTAAVGASINGHYWTIATGYVKYYIWYTNGSGVNPNLPGYTGISASFVNGDSADTLATNTKAALDGISGSPFTTTIGGAGNNVLTIVNTSPLPPLIAPTNGTLNAGNHNWTVAVIAQNASSTLVLENNSNNNVPFTLYTATATMTNPWYHNGYFYFLLNGDIYAAPAGTFTSTVTLVNITNLGNITAFSVFNFTTSGITTDVIIYVNTLSQTWQIWAPNGNNAHQISGPGGITMEDPNVIGIGASAFYIYLDPANSYQITILPVDAPPINGAVLNATLPMNLKHLVTDTFSQIWYIDQYNSLWYVELDPNNNFAILTGPTQLDTAVNYLGSYWQVDDVIAGQHLSIVHTDQELHAHPAEVDYDFSYLINIVPEIMSYRAAIDFKVKQGADVTQLSMRLKELWKRFDDTVRRNIYKRERVQNFYRNYSNAWM